jgi:hypothetical protein
MTRSVVAGCLVSAVVGGLAGGFAVSLTQDGPAGPRGLIGPIGPRGSEGPPAPIPLHGGYVLGEVDLSGAANCPAGTVPANAALQVETNSASGRSPFGLCAIK